MSPNYGIFASNVYGVVKASSSIIHYTDFSLAVKGLFLSRGDGE
jgi:hypothetical protein